MAELTVEFRGWYQCRMSTDPDPTWERRGVSGYTLAYGNENDFDTIIRLQRDEIADVDYRPAEPGVAEVGVKVTASRVSGAEFPLLAGARLRLDGDPTYALWNQVLGDGVQRLAPIIDPFRLHVEGEGGTLLSRGDPLPGNEPLWRLGADPAEYADRVPAYVRRSDEVILALGLAPEDLSENHRSPWFERRRLWLDQAIDDSPAGSLEQGGFEHRAAVIDAYSAKATNFFLDNRLGLQAVWDHPVRGDDAHVSSNVANALAELGHRVDVARPWHVRYWHGGWDGDLMRGLMKGRLAVPLRPA